MKLFFSLEKCEFAAWSEWTVCDKNQKQRLRNERKEKKENEIEKTWGRNSQKAEKESNL